MANPSGRKGSGYEALVRDYLNDSGAFVTEVLRSPRWGVNDKGDLTGTGPWVLELKAVRSLDLAGFMAEAEGEAKNAGRPWPVVVVKRRQKPVGKSYVVLTLDTWLEVARALG